MPSHDLSQAAWRTSSYSGQNGSCVEVAVLPAWRTSSACVEVATNLPGHVAVRDSKDRGGEVLAFDAVAWREFVGRVKSGRADVG